MLLMLGLSFGMISCSGDDDDVDKAVCLSCTSDDPNVTIEGEDACVGDTDPDTGEELTREDLVAAQTLLESFGADCTLE